MLCVIRRSTIAYLFHFLLLSAAYLECVHSATGGSVQNSTTPKPCIKDSDPQTTAYLKYEVDLISKKFEQERKFHPSLAIPFAPIIETLERMLVASKMGFDILDELFKVTVRSEVTVLCERATVEVQKINTECDKMPKIISTLRAKQYEIPYDSTIVNELIKAVEMATETIVEIGYSFLFDIALIVPINETEEKLTSEAQTAIRAFTEQQSTESSSVVTGKESKTDNQDEHAPSAVKPSPVDRSEIQPRPEATIVACSSVKAKLVDKGSVEPQMGTKAHNQDATAPSPTKPSSTVVERNEILSNGTATSRINSAPSPAHEVSIVNARPLQGSYFDIVNLSSIVKQCQIILKYLAIHFMPAITLWIERRKETKTRSGDVTVASPTKQQHPINRK